jgi:multiple sugar transport system substrate-binding protein
MAAPVSRRRLLGLGLGAAAGPLVLTSRRPADAQTAAPARPAFDWMQQKGKSLVVTVPLSPYYTVLQKMIPDFAKLSGIQVEYQVVPEQQLRQKLPIELTAKSPAIDVFASSMHVERLLFSAAGWYEPLDKYLTSPNLTPPDYNWKDFGPAGTYWGLRPDGTVVAIPMGVGLFAYIYRRDLYDQKGLRAATTVDELVAAVKATHQPPAVYGFAGRGLKNANIPVWGCLLSALGGAYLDDSKTKLLTTSTEAVEAARVYGDLMRSYAPPGSLGFNWMEAQGAFAQGLVGTWTDGMSFAASFEDPAKSKVAGKVGYAPHPGSARMKPFGGTAMDALALNPFGKNKDASWLFTAWASSRPVHRRLMLEGAMVGTRNSIYEDADFVKQHTMPAHWVAGVHEAIKNPKPQLPELRDVTQFRDIFGVALTKVVEGGDAKALLEQATREFEPIFQRGLKM